MQQAAKSKRSQRAGRKPQSRKSGSIYREKDGKLAVAVSYRRTVDGKRKRLKKRAQTEDEAKALLDELRLQAKPDHDLSPSTTLEGFLRRWLQYVIRPYVKLTTLDTCRTMAEKHIYPWFGAATIGSLNPDAIQEFYGHLKKQGCSDAILRSVHCVLRWSLRSAVIWNVLAENPVSGAKPPKFRLKQIRPIYPDEIGEFLKVAEQSRLYALWVLLLFTGLRLGEALALRWDDLDTKSGNLAIQRTLIEIRGRHSIGPPKTPGSRRGLLLPRFVVKVLLEHKKRMEEASINSAYIFTNTRGGPLFRGNLHRTSFKPLLREAGLPDIPIHNLRHSAGVLLFHMNVPVKVIAERLGHKSTSTCINRYLHLLPEMEEVAARELDRLFTSRAA